MATNTTDATVQAAGRSISEANASRLKTAHESLATGERILRDVLSESGHLAAIATSPGGYPKPPFAGSSSEVNAAALSLTDETQLRLWTSRVDTALELCHKHLRNPGEDSPEAIAATIAVLREAIADLPAPPARDSAWSDLPIRDWDYYDYYDYFLCHGLTESVTTETRRFQLVTAIKCFVYHFFGALHDLPDPVEAMTGLVDELAAILTGMTAEPIAAASEGESSDPIQDETPVEGGAIAVEAAAGEYEAVWDLALAAASVDLEAAADDDAVPIEGILFRVDEPSECAPSVGPRLPMMISADVAAAAMRRVLGYPLDADESLEAHGGGIVGAITEGKVDGQDAVIRGLLHGYHLPQKVAEIRAAARSGELGMSMVGSVYWHRGTVNGQDVAVVDRLNLKGGTILRASVATYRKTRVKLLSAVDRNGRALPVAAAAEETPLAASATPEPSDVTTSDPTDMTTNQDLSIDAIVEAMAAKFLPPIESLNDRLTAIEAKQHENEQAEADRLAAEQAAAAESAAVQAMADRVIEAIGPSIDQRIQALIGTPRPVATAPRRITAAPLLPGATTPIAAAADDRMAALLGQLSRTPPHNIAARVAIKQQIADLERNAAIAQH